MMPSIRCRLFLLALNIVHILKSGKRRRKEVDWNTSLTELRREVEKSAGSFGKTPKDFRIESVSIDGLYAEWIIPPESPEDKAVLYFHGGGLVLGSAKSHRGIVGKFAGGAGVRALCFDYSLAPERPFPHGLNDAVDAYSYLLDEGYQASDIVFMGDSGGAGLSLATLLALKERNLPQPSASVTLSPWVDLTNSGASLTENAEHDKLCWKEAQAVFAQYYTGENDPANPLVSALFGDLQGLPPLLIYVGSHELLRDDSTRFAEKAKQAGVDVELHVGEGLFHCYPACAPLFPEASRARDEISRFIKRRLGLSA